MDLTSELTSLMALTEAELTEARNNQWDRVTELEGKRLLLMKKLMNRQDEGHVEALRSALEQLIDKQSELLSCAEVRKNEIAEHLSRFRKGNKAVKAYKGI